jgi:hypothetical protein
MSLVALLLAAELALMPVQDYHQYERPEPQVFYHQLEAVEPKKYILDYIPTVEKLPFKRYG